MRSARLLVVIVLWLLLTTFIVLFALRVSVDWSWLSSVSARVIAAVLAVAACTSALVDVGLLRPAAAADGGAGPGRFRQRPAIPAALVAVAALAFIAVPGGAKDSPDAHEPSPSPSPAAPSPSTAPPASAPATKPTTEAPGACLEEIDFDRYANNSKPVGVGLHANVQGVDNWPDDKLWVLIYAKGLGYFPAYNPPMRGGDLWRSETMQFGDDNSGPDGIEREIVLVRASEAAFKALTDAKGQLLVRLPAGADPADSVRTVRTC
jgi:hypothetical protein